VIDEGMGLRIPQEAPPTLGEQVSGVFLEPGTLFRRLGQRPRWAGALTIQVLTALAMVAAWAARVDSAALVRPSLERAPGLTTPQAEAFLTFLAARQIMGLGRGGAAACTLVAAVVWTCVALALGAR